MQPTTTPYPATLTSSAASLRAVLKDWSTLSEAAQAKVLAGLPTHWLDDFRGEFETFAHDHQRPPRLANSGQDWITWLMLGGRGAGKTRAGAEWVRRTALADPTRAHRAGRRDRTRNTRSDGGRRSRACWPCIGRPSGRSGFLARRLEWPNGAVAQLFSAEDPEGLRGPQFSAAWCDELAKWRQAEATFDMLQFGLRLGERPRQVITTTPRPIALLKTSDRRSAHRDHARRHARPMPTIWRRLSSRRCCRAMAARSSGGRRSTARSSRSAATRLWSRAQLESCAASMRRRR